MKSVPKERRGAASSTNYIGNDLGNLTGPVLAGTIIDHVGYAPMWRLMTIPLFIAIAVVLICRKRIMGIENAFAVTNAKEAEKELETEAEILEP
jgi:MFS family permease